MERDARQLPVAVVPITQVITITLAAIGSAQGRGNLQRQANPASAPSARHQDGQADNSRPSAMP